MHIVIIGCGYLGHRAATKWLEQGHQITALTRSVDHAKAWNRQGIATVIGDVLEPLTLAKLPTAHALLYAVGYDRKATADKRTVYVQGLSNAISALGSKIPRWIYISSTSVYGQSGGELVDESSPCEPITEGGAICLDAERTLTAAVEEGQLERATILRLAGLYGPGRMLARIEQFKKGTPIEGRGDAWLNLVHVDDAVTACDRLLHTHPQGLVYLLSDSHPIQRQQFYGRLAELINAPAPQFIPGDSQDLGKRCDSSCAINSLAINLAHPRSLDTLPSLIG